jgi:hypothetical protein
VRVCRDPCCPQTLDITFIPGIIAVLGAIYTILATVLTGTRRWGDGEQWRAAEWSCSFPMTMLCVMTTAGVTDSSMLAVGSMCAHIAVLIG